MKLIVVLSSVITASVALGACSLRPIPATDGKPAVADTAADDGKVAGYEASIAKFRSEREKRLRQPDGWMSFAGSGVVDAGVHRVGVAPDNDIVLTVGPAHWGVLHLEPDGGLRFAAAPDAGVTVGGKPFDNVALLTQLDDGGPTSIHAGDRRFYVVKTGDIFGWRLRDPESPALKAFAGVPHFPTDASWRIDARWEAFAEPRTIQLVTSNGTFHDANVPGRATFTREGRDYSLLPVQEKGEDQLFFIVADRTNGKETYGGARFLYADAPHDGKVELDFNKALNPPCALNGHVVCPTAPRENRLDLRVLAGEKTYPVVH